ncbi:MAG: ATP-binding protein [Colwellia sp.]|nr:ATP-binding protein [Colwellia sp.]
MSKYHLLVMNLLLILIGSLTSKVQAITFQNIGVNEGLPQSSINSMIQDKTGFMWFATNDGLARYDSRSFKVYKAGSGHGLNANSLMQTHLDHEKVLWVSSLNELYSYNESTDYFTKLVTADKTSNKLLSQPISSITSSEQSLWLIIDNLPYRYNKTTRKLIPLSVQHLSYDSALPTIFVKNNSGDIWLIHNQVSYWVDVINNILHLVKTKHTPLRNTAIIKKNNGQLHFLSNNRLFCPTKRNYVDECGLTKYIPQAKTGNSLIITEHINGSYWLGSHALGLLQLNKDLSLQNHYKYNKDNPMGLLNNDINQVFIDKQNNIWLTNYGKGVSKISATALKFNTFNTSAENNRKLSHNHSRVFYQSDKENLWLGTFNGLNHINMTTNKISSYYLIGDGQALFHQNFIRGIERYDDQNLLILLGKSFKATPLWLFNTIDKKWTPMPFLKNTTSNSSGFSMIKDGNTLWLALVGSGLLKYDLKNKSWLKPNWLPTNLQLKNINNLYFDQENCLWIATMHHGALKYDFDSKILTHFSTTASKTKLNNNWVKSFLHDSVGNLWIGTVNGLHRYNKKANTMELFTTKDGLSNNTIYGILADDLGFIWLSTNNGLNRYSTMTGVFEAFHKNDGIAGEEFNTGAYYKGLDGKFYFGGVDGFINFSPQDFVDKHQVDIPLLITEIKILNSSLSTHSEKHNIKLAKQVHLINTLQLGAEHQVFSIDFTAINFVNIQSTHYQYRVQGLSEQWINLNTNNRATFTGLPAGRFLLQMRAINTNSGEVYADNSLVINISPPWWQTPLAYIFYLISILLIFSFIYWRRVHSLKEKTKLLKQAVMARTSELNEALIEKENIFNHISHEFRTPLTLIDGPAQDLLDTVTDQQAKKSISMIQSQSKYLLRLVNQLLSINSASNNNNYYKTILDISPQLSAITNAFKVSAKQKNIHFKQNISQSLTGFFKDEDIAQLFNNLLSNAIKFTSSGGIVSFNARIVDDFIIFDIIDNGCGINNKEHQDIWEKFYRGSNNNGEHLGTGLGLTLVKALVSKYQGYITLTSNVNEGCHFTVTLPYHKATEEITGSTTLNRQSIYTEIEVNNLANKQVPEQQEKLNLKDNSLEKILIVEDNPSLKEYLVEKLSSKYLCLTANNGSDGFKIAIQEQPKIIISDIMMPILNGLELCEKLKLTVATSHIPVILLTAKSDQKSRILGLKHKANIYLNKPFDFNELALYISNLLKERDDLKQFYLAGMPNKNPPMNQLANAEKTFINHLNKVLEKHFADPEFQPVSLASNLAMSERQLQRKFKSIAGIKPSHFIRQWRLNKSKKMLIEGQPIGNIALNCGFNSQAYYTKCFKQSFNCTPSQFIEQKENEISEILK